MRLTYFKKAREVLMRIHMRHGAHQDNILTARGQAEVQASAQELALRLQEAGILQVILICSPVLRAIASAALVGAVLAKHGITALGGLKIEQRLDVVKGASALMETTGVKYGSGFVRAWKRMEEQRLLPGTESYTMVAQRVQKAFEDTEAAGLLVIAVYHGGSIEPAAGIEHEDVPSGALVIETDDNVQVINPSTIHHNIPPFDTPPFPPFPPA